MASREQLTPMLPNDEHKSDDIRSRNRAPTRQELLERIQYNRDLKRIDSAARRRVGAATPFDAEVEAVYAARKAAEALQREEALQRDRHRRGVGQSRYYDTLLAAETDDVFQEAPPLSDVEARRAVLQPVKKLVAILAARQRFSCLLRFASDVGVAKTAQTDLVPLDLTTQSALPSVSPLPSISTLVRGITLPEVGGPRRLAHLRETDLSYDLVERPRSLPCHEPFVFRLKHFTPVAMPEFVLDVVTHAEKEVRRGEGEGPSSEEGNNVPKLIAVQPLETVMNAPPEGIRSRECAGIERGHAVTNF